MNIRTTKFLSLIIFLLFVFLVSILLMSQNVYAVSSFLTDTCSNFDKVYEKSSAIGIDTSNQDKVNKDGSRFVSNAADQWVTYDITGKTMGEITSHFWDKQPISHFKFYTSSDNITWAEVTPGITSKLSTINDYWHFVTYVFNKFPEGAKYLKIQWPEVTENYWAAQVGLVYLTDGVKFDSYLFAQDINTSRNRELIKVVQPDVIHRGVFEWVGTFYSDRNFEDVVKSIDEMHNAGSIVIGGMSAHWWAPDAESGPATVDQTTKDKCSIPNTGWDDVRAVNLDAPEALEQLIYKAEKQIDAGVDGIEYDEFGLGHTDQAYVKSAFQYIRSRLKSYAMDNYGKDVLITANSTVGGQDFPNFTNATNDGTEPVDYYIRNLPYKLVGLVDNQFASNAHYDGTYNFIPQLRAAHEKVWPKRFAYFRDFGSSTGYWGPRDPSEWANWYRISSAYVIASGGFPGYFKSFYNEEQDALEMGIFSHVANIHKFMEENAELWKNLKFINPQVTISNNKVYPSAFEQNERTILHLVNGNYDNTTQQMTAVENLTAQIPLNSTPSGIWMTTPDKLSKDRKTELSYTYADGVATIIVPKIEFHDVIVIEQGLTQYNPTYAPLQVKLPFRLPQAIPVDNTIHITAVTTDGNSNEFNWYVNNIAGGDNNVGTIDANGNYKAPSTIPQAGAVTIKAVSTADNTTGASISLGILPKRTIPYTEQFTNDVSGQQPLNWEIVDGKGDWQTTLDGETKVLNNFNISEGFGNADKQESALYAPFIVSGDQTWSDYEYKVSAKLQNDPIYFYGQPKGTALAIVFRYKDYKNYYEYIIDAENKVYLYKVSNGAISQIGEGIVSNFLNKESYLNLSVQAYQENFRLLINSVVVREDKDSDSPILNGGIGIKASFIKGMYKDISVGEVAPFVAEDITTFKDTCDVLDKVFQSSSALYVDSSNPVNFHGDAGRIGRYTATQEWVSYELKNKFNMKAIAYYWDKEAISHFKFFVSSDNTTWDEIIPKITVENPAQTDYWYKVTYTKNDLPSSAKYLKIQWENTSGNPWTPQLGEVQIQTQHTEPVDDRIAITDNCSDFSKVYGKTDNIGISTDNTDKVGDDARFWRQNPSQNDWVTYDVNGKRHVQVSAGFWDQEPISHFSFYVSKDYSNWTEVTPNITEQISEQRDYWHNVIYNINNLPVDAKYLKIQWGNLNGMFWSPQLKEVVFDNKVPVVDDFESYYGNDTELQAAYSRNSAGNNVSLSLDSVNKFDGDYGMKFEYTMGNPPYAGVIKKLGGVSWMGSDAISFWLKPDASNNKLVIQFKEVNGEYWETEYTLAGTEAKLVTLPFTSFAHPGWFTGGNGVVDLESIEELSIYVNKNSENTGVSSIYFDSIETVKVEDAPGMYTLTNTEVVEEGGYRKTTINVSKENASALTDARLLVVGERAGEGGQTCWVIDLATPDGNNQSAEIAVTEGSFTTIKVYLIDGLPNWESPFTGVKADILTINP